MIYQLWNLPFVGFMQSHVCLRPYAGNGTGQVYTWTSVHCSVCLNSFSSHLSRTELSAAPLQKPESFWSRGNLQKGTALFFWWLLVWGKLLKVGYNVTGCVLCQNTDGLNLAASVFGALEHRNMAAPLLGLHQGRTEICGRFCMGVRCGRCWYSHMFMCSVWGLCC